MNKQNKRCLSAYKLALFTGVMIAAPVQAMAHLTHTQSQFGEQGKNVFSIPAITTGVGFYDKHRNEQLAAWSLRQIHANLPLIEDPWSVQTLTQMSAEMNTLVRPLPLYSVVLINDKNINAFAVPGGLIGMNTGTILSSQGLDEVASVLAHEIAHISQRHYESRLENNKKLLAMQIGGLLAAIAASAASGDAAVMAMAGAQTASAEGAATHSREHEREADRVGMQILSQAGYDARAMPRFFARLHRQTTLNSSGQGVFLPTFVQSHPFTSERLSEATARADSHLPPSMSQRQEQAVLFDRWFWRLKYLTKQTTHTELISNAEQSAGARLALALWLADHHRHQEAKQTLEAGKFDAYDPLVCLTKAHLFATTKQYNKAVNELSVCQKIYPERRDLRVQLAEYHIHAGDAKSALVLLSSLTNDGSYDSLAWSLAQQAYELLARTANDPDAKNNANIHALRSRSQVELWRADYKASLQSLAQAIKIATDYDKQSLLALLKKDQQLVQAAKDFQPK